MDTMSTPHLTGTIATAVNAPNQFVEIGGRRLAYRVIGRGKPVVLCVRFRGNLDSWDPAFLDALAANGFQAITFDYSGVGLSTGQRSLNPFDLAKDARDLIEALDLKDVVIGGWSLGGLAAQVVLTMFPERISHAVLIGTGPPGPLIKNAEQLFYDVATKPVNDFEDFVTLFFEPRSDASRQAARRSLERMAQRTSDLSVPIPHLWAKENLGSKPTNPAFPADAVLERLKSTTIPILHIGADHDICFPVENWYALNQQLPTMQLVTFPSAGHGPQHQHPEAAAASIANFVRTAAN